MFSVDNLVEYGPLGLFVVAFLESTVFPIPPDLILIPLCLTVPKLSFWYAFLTTFASVLGGVCGYFAGQRAGRPLVVKLSSPRIVNDVERLLARYGGWAVGIAAFTPIPFKVFTFSAGIFQVPFWTFLTAASFGRAGRFFLEGAAVFFLGERARQFLGRGFDIATLALTAAAFVLIALAPRLPKIRTIKLALSDFNRYVGSAFHDVVKNPGARVSAMRLVSTVILLVFSIAFLEDAAGPEVSALNRSLGLLAMHLAPMVAPLGPLWNLVRSPVWMAAYAALALLRATAAVLPWKSWAKMQRPKRVAVSHWILRAASAILMTCLIHAGLLVFFANSYCGVLQPPDDSPVLPCFIILCSAAFFAIGFRPPVRATIFLTAGLICVGLLAFAVHTGALEPAAAGSVFLLSALTSSIDAMLLEIGDPRR